MALVIGASIVGSIVALISLPALLGMLVTGIVLKSVHFFVVEGVYIDIVSVSRYLQSFFVYFYLLLLFS